MSYSVKGSEFIREKQGSLWKMVEDAFPKFNEYYFKWRKHIHKLVKAFLGINIYDDPVWNSYLSNDYSTKLRGEFKLALGADVTMGFMFGPNQEVVYHYLISLPKTIQYYVNILNN